MKSGFVNIIGNPNVGKSTLMNELVGEKVSIVTSKSQTTRHRILGIVNGENYQVILSDTPGIIKPRYLLQERMMNFVVSSFEDSDLFLYVTDVVESPDKNIEYIEKLRNVTTPILCLINKIDLFPDDDISNIENFWKETLPNAEIIKISALNKVNTEILLPKIISLLPESHPWFPTDQLSDKPDRFIVTEIVREKILQNYQKEIPYSCEVVCDEFKEDDNIIRIKTIINVERDSQKGIIIGNKGAALKKTSTESRLDMEKFFGKKVYLETFVKVKKDWRSNELFLKKFGYL